MKSGKGLGCFTVAMFVVMMAICVAMFSSCTTTKYVPVIEHKTDTVLKHSTKHDSIWVHDSIRVSEVGDTIKIEKWHTKYIEKDVHDTTYIAKIDSIPQPYPVTEYVEKPRSIFEKGLMVTGIVALMGLILFLVIKIKRFLP